MRSGKWDVSRRWPLHLGFQICEIKSAGIKCPAGTYSDLSDKGVLSVADGLHVQPVPLVWQSIVDRWGVPVRVVCDRFRLGELEDAIQGACPMSPSSGNGLRPARTLGHCESSSRMGRCP